MHLTFTWVPRGCLPACRTKHRYYAKSSYSVEGSNFKLKGPRSADMLAYTAYAMMSFRASGMIF